MDAQFTNGVIVSACTTVAAAAITGFFLLRKTRLELAHQTRVQTHAERKDEFAELNTVVERYRQATEDAEDREKVAREAEKEAKAEASTLAKELRLMRFNCKNRCDEETNQK